MRMAPYLKTGADILHPCRPERPLHKGSCVANCGLGSYGFFLDSQEWQLMNCEGAGARGVEDRLLFGNRSFQDPSWEAPSLYEQLIT